MIDLNEYILESVFDEPSDAEFHKQMIDKVKAWVKTIEKYKGRAKFNSKTGKVTLPEGSVGIFCPIPEYVSFEDINVSNGDKLTIYNPSDNDLNKLSSLQYRRIEITGHIHKRTSITHIPKNWDGLYELRLYGLNDDIDLSNLTQTISLDIRYIGNKINVSGIENIKRADYIVIDGGKYGVHIDGTFNKLHEATINMTNVKCSPELFKKVKKVTCARCDYGAELKDCIIDLSNIGYMDQMKLTADDLKSEFLPKKIDTLYIYGDINRIDILSGIDSDINKIFIYDGDADKQSILNSNILKDKDSVNAILSLNKCLGSRDYYCRRADSDKLPVELLEYFRKKAKEIEISEYKDNHHYILFSKDLKKMTYVHNSKGCVIYYDEGSYRDTWRSTNKDTRININHHSNDYIFQLSGISIEVAKLITEELI